MIRNLSLYNLSGCSGFLSDSYITEIVILLTEIGTGSGTWATINSDLQPTNLQNFKTPGHPGDSFMVLIRKHLY